MSGKMIDQHRGIAKIKPKVTNTFFHRKIRFRYFCGIFLGARGGCGPGSSMAFVIAGSCPPQLGQLLNVLSVTNVEHQPQVRPLITTGRP